MTTRTRETKADVTNVEARIDEGASQVRAIASSILRALPNQLDGAGEAMAETFRTMSASVAAAPDEDVLGGASLAAGVAIGVLVSRGPRLFAAGAVATSVALGAALLGRRPGHSLAQRIDPAN